jgi:5-methylcytosine-specific restriction protein A
MPKRPPGNAWGYVGSRTRARIRAQVFARDNYRCQIKLPGCTGAAEEIDHIVPIGKGGALLELTNLRAACVWCNQSRTLYNRTHGSQEGERPAANDW